MPDFRAPLDLERRKARLPSDGTVKGMFFQNVLGIVKKRARVDLRSHPYHAFRDYRVSDWLDLLAEAAATVYPGVPAREGLRRLGQGMCPTVVNTTVGKIMFTVAGDDLHRALAVYPKVWQVISNHGTAAVKEISVGHCLIELRNVWDFPDSFQIGAIEGGFGIFSRRAQVRIELLSDCDANYDITW